MAPRNLALAALLLGTADAAPPVMYAVDGQRDVLIMIDLKTGATMEVGPLGFDGGFWGLAFNPVPVPGPAGSTWAPGTLFGIEVSTQSLYTINPATGLAALVGPVGALGVWEPLTFDLQGTLWTADVYDRFAVNSATGQASHVPGGFSVPGGVAYSMDTLRVPVPAPGGMLPAGTIIACRAGRFFALDGATWDLLLDLEIPQVQEVVAAAPDGTIYAVGGPPGDLGLWRISLSPAGADFIGPLNSGSIWGGAIIPAPACLPLIGAAAWLGARRRR